MGAIGAVPAEDGAGLLEPGYALGRRYWGQGYATEALAAVVRYLFESEGQAALACCHAHENPASGRVMKKCGMKYEGTMRQADINKQGICDFSEYGILAEDYFGGKQAEK